jgi:hypothetical protein
MVIYQVEQGKVTPGKIGYITNPRIMLYQSYADAIKARGNHGGELSKYEDCNDADFSNREIWIERNIPSQLPAALVETVYPVENIQTVIFKIEVE